MRPTTKHIERFLAGLIFAILTWGMYTNISSQFFAQNGDSAGIVDMVSNVAAGKGMQSSAFTACASMMPYFGAQPEVYLKASLTNQFADTCLAKWHSYLISYFFAAVVKLSGLSSLNVLSGAMALNLAGTLLLIYWFLRRSKLGALVSLLFVALVFTFPPFNGNIFGQMYFDRFFILPCLLLLILAFEEAATLSWRTASKLLLFIFCVLISERMALMAVFAMLGVHFFKEGFSMVKTRWLTILFGVLGFVYFWVYMKYFQDSPYYSGMSFAGFKGNLILSFSRDFHLFPKTMKFLVVLLPFFILSLFRPLFAIFFVLSIIPNFIISIGGAEKNGFTIHYHTTYLPMVIFSAALGLVACQQMLVKRKLRFAIPIVLSMIIVFQLYFDEYDLRKTMAFRPHIKIATVINAMPLLNAKQLVANQRVREFRANLTAGIPPTAHISVGEGMMPILVYRGFQYIDYFPIGLDANEYLICEYILSGNTETLMVLSFLKPEKVNEIAMGIQKRIELTHEIVATDEFQGMRYKVFKVKHSDKQTRSNNIF